MPSLKVTNKKVVSAQEFNRLVDYINSLKMNSGVGYLVSRNRTGTTLKIKPGSGGSAATVCPFDPVIGELDTPSDTSKKLTIQPGSVNQLLPDNMFDDFTISTSDLIKVKVRATSDGESITGATLVVDTNEAEVQIPTPFALPTVVEILVAVVYEGVAFRVLPCGSIVLSGVEQFRIDKDPPAEPGEMDSEIFYAWVPQ